MPHLDPAVITPQDIVIVAKSLPWPVMAQICAKTERVEFLITNIPRGLRGKSLSAQQLRELNAYLAPMNVMTTEENISNDAILVTRHPGAQVWLRQRFPNAPLVEHWEDADWQRVKPGTSVIGVFPPELVLEVNKRGGTFHALHFVKPLPFGAELSLEEMAEYEPHLQGYRVQEGDLFQCSGCGEAWMVPHSWCCPNCGSIGNYKTN